MNPPLWVIVLHVIVAGWPFYLAAALAGVAIWAERCDL